LLQSGRKAVSKFELQET